MTVTSTRAWLVLVAICIAIFAALVWSVFGEIPTKVKGQGIMIKTGGVYQVLASGTGQITEVTVKPGEQVHSGQIIARVAQPALTDKVNDMRLSLHDLEIEYEKTKTFLESSSLLNDKLSKQNIESLKEKITLANKEAVFERKNFFTEESL